MADPITPEEHAWALDCLARGDTVAEVAEWSDRSIGEWTLALGAAATVPATWSERLAYYDLDRNMVKVGERYGVSRHAIANMIDKARAKGLPVPRHEAPDRYSDEFRAQVIAEANNRVAYCKIAARFGIDQATVRKIAGPSQFLRGGKHGARA